MLLYLWLHSDVLKMDPVRPLFHLDDKLDLPLDRHLVAQFRQVYRTRDTFRYQNFSLHPNGNLRRDLLYRKWKFLSVLIETMAKVFFLFEEKKSTISFPLRVALILSTSKGIFASKVTLKGIFSPGPACLDPSLTSAFLILLFTRAEYVKRKSAARPRIIAIIPPKKTNPCLVVQQRRLST